MKKIFHTKLYIAVISLIVIFLIGTLYFRFFSNYSWVDAFYFTVITATTVGFNEVHPLTEAEKIFTTGLILASIFVLGFAITVITENIFSKNNISNLRQKKVEKKIKKWSRAKKEALINEEYDKLPNLAKKKF